jgi:predicted Zn-dependent protease
MSKIIRNLLIAFLATLPKLGMAQLPNNPSEGLQELFESFAERAGPMAPMFGKLTPDQVARIEAIDVSTTEENRFGTQVLDAYLEQLRKAKVAVSNRGSDVEYLQDLCASIQPQMKQSKRYKRLDIRLVESDSTDACSIPGGHILITRGLLDTCGSEAALVGVIAHELSHLDRGHQLLSLKQSKLAGQRLSFNDSVMLISLVARPFRPEQESEADFDATEWMMRAGYDARELVKLLESWQQREIQTTPWMQFIPGFVKSHPNAGKRAQEILRRSQHLAIEISDAKYIGIENLQQRIPKLQHEFR